MAKLKLIPDWRQAWTYLSVHAAVLLGLLAAAYDYLPAARSYMPDGWVKWMALVIIIARLINQPEKSASQP